jgi:large subunit ribosomal protein L18
MTPRLARQGRVRRKVRGVPDRPRLCVFRSANHIYVQAIDDENRVTLASASSKEKGFDKPQAAPPAPPKEGEAAPAVKGAKILCSEAIGEAIAKRLIEKGITKAVFDRNGFLYHGRVKAVADAARRAGLNF